MADFANYSLFEETYVEFSERGQEALETLTSDNASNSGFGSAYRISFRDFFGIDVPVQDRQIQNQKDLEEDLEAKEIMDKDYAPLSQHCVRALCDKMYDKRKAAALEIEKLTKDCISVNNTNQVNKLLRVLGHEFAMSQNPNMRKGGLIGLAAMAIGMGKESKHYVNDLVKPVLSCMDDSDSRVRFYACESLYNVTKVAREEILHLFNDIFIAMGKVVTDLDQSVRTAAELLDRLLKDIITENVEFSTENFVPTLKAVMYTEDQFARSFCIGWVQAMHKVPNPCIVHHIPDIIDPLFRFLRDPRHEIYTRTQRELLVFISAITKDPPSNEDDYIIKIVNSLVEHVQSPDIRVQTMSVHWIRAFAAISGPLLFSYISGILMAVLPNLSYDEQKRREVSEVNYRKIRIESKRLYMDLMKILENEAKRLRSTTNEEDLKNLAAILNVVTDELNNGKTESKVGALKWINLLFTILNKQMAPHIDTIFPTLLKTLSDSNDEVVILDLRVLAVICKPSGNKHFQPLMFSLYTLFKADRNLLQTKGHYILRQLSIYLSSEEIFKSLAEMLQKEEDLKFSRLLVEDLNMIMFTAKELQGLRDSIRSLESKQSKDLFVCLYKTWSHSQAPIIALVFLAGCYSHALDLVHEISKQEMTIEFLLELDRFIQLLESPMFAHLRYELLDPKENADLVRALYGLLNLMPQTEQFKVLNSRLSNLPKNPLNQPPPSSPKKAKKEGVGNKHPKDIDFSALLSHFCQLQNCHEALRKKEVSDDVVSEDEAEKMFEMQLSESENVEFSMIDD